jgi:glycerol uptake facilitator-like aquaporin
MPPSSTPRGQQSREFLFARIGMGVGFVAVAIPLWAPIQTGELNPAIALVLMFCGSIGLGLASKYWGEALWMKVAKWFRPER